jgi:hypothetical protein
MKNFLAMILPIAVGAGLGLLLFHPPSWVTPSGPGGFLVAGGIVFILLIVFIAISMAASIPAQVRLRPIEGLADPSVLSLVRELKELGFVEAGGPYLVEIRPAAALVPFVHLREPVYATVFRTGTLPAATSYDFVSIFEAAPGGLTTTSNWRGGTVPGGPGEFRQILKGAGFRQVYETHLEGIRWLRDRGLRAKDVSADSFTDDFLQALGRHRRHYRSTALKSAVISFWRTFSRKGPDSGILASQKCAEGRARAFLAGENASRSL